MIAVKKISALVLACILCLPVLAQEPFYKSYNWEAAPKGISIETLDQSEGQIILKDARIFEYAYEKSGDLIVYVTKHRKIKVFSDKGIENNNKIYIPTSGIIEFMDIQARSISPSGKISNISKSDIKDIDNVENKGSFKMFAVDGIEKNSEIEYIYTYKKNSNYFGTEFCQNAIPRLNFEFKIIAPQNLTFEAKVYNSSAEVKKDTSATQNTISVAVPKIDALKEEKYSLYNTNLVRIEYKLAYNTVKGKARLLTWDNAADRYYNVFYVYDKKEISAVTSFLKKLNLSGTDELAKIRQLENHLKIKFEIKESNSDAAENIEKILSSKMANNTGTIRLYMCCLAQMGIKRELVLTCSASDVKFDPAFDTWNYLDSYLIYFPGQNIYLSPVNVLSRLGFVPPEYTGHKGLFVKEVDLGEGEAKSGIAKMKEIPYPDQTVSVSSLDAAVTFNSDLNETSVNLTQTYTGYGAYYNQPLINFLSDLQKREFQEGTMKITGEDAVMSNVEMKGYAEEDILNKPFVISCLSKSPSLLEKAGNKHLLKIGLLIGPQAELYQESERKTPAEITYTHAYVRKITVTIPDGYKLSGAEGLKMKQTVMQEDQIAAEFVSEYQLTGNTLKVTVLENYRKLFFPVSQFEDFRKVINAAANFNKITVILEKN